MMGGDAASRAARSNARAQQALDLLRAGRRMEAETLLQEILAEQPRHFHALHLLGVAALEKRDCARACLLLGEAVALNPGSAAAHSNLAVALLDQLRPAEALRSCELALRIEPNHMQACINRGNSLRALGRPAEALTSYERAIALGPALSEARAGRGNALFDLRRYAEALLEFEQALELVPSSEFLMNDVARTLLRLRRPEEALLFLSRALERNPAFVEALSNRGSALRELQQPRAAMESYQAALQHDPTRADLHSNLANLLLNLGRAAAALEAAERALSLRPELIEATEIRAQALRALGRRQESALMYERVLELDPERDYTLGKVFHAKASACDWLGQRQLAKRIDAGVKAGKLVCTPMIYLAVSGSPAAQLQCARRYVEDTLPQVMPLESGAEYHHARTGHANHRIRIAYVSADFRDHPVAHLLVGVLEHHDRGAFEVHAVSTDLERRGAPVLDRIRASVEHFHDVSESSDRDVAWLLRELQVDIAIDLGGHTRGSRLGIFAHRSAPVQVSYLGFMGTSGVEFLDYVIADAMALPGHLQAHFTEQIVQLPCSFLPNDDSQRVADRTSSRAEAGLPERGFVFCAFHNPHKIDESMFELWVQLLHRVPDSVLWLRDGETAMREALRAQAARRGVDSSRLVFASMLASSAEHLARYRLAGLFLDTLPYGAHATARDALWAGLPVLTCLGEAFAGRVAASLLHALGLDELIAGDTAQYLERAAYLAESPPVLSKIRGELAARRDGAMFCTARYCRHLEAAFLAMHERRTRGERPQAFIVPG